MMCYKFLQREQEAFLSIVKILKSSRSACLLLLDDPVFSPGHSRREISKAKMKTQSSESGSIANEIYFTANGILYIKMGYHIAFKQKVRSIA